MKRVIFREHNGIPNSLNGLLSYIIERKGNYQNEGRLIMSIFSTKIESGIGIFL